jgi:hypothetical protein
MLREDSVIIPFDEVPPEIVHYGRVQAEALGITLRDFMIVLLRQEYERRPGAPFDPSKVETLVDWRLGQKEGSPNIFDGEFGSPSDHVRELREQLVSGDA